MNPAMSTPSRIMGPAAALFLLAALPAIAGAQEPEPSGPDRIRVTGLVLDAVTGSPVRGAIVGLESERQVTVTNESGVFEFGRVRPGYLKLRVEQLGYAQTTLTAEVGPEAGPLRIDLEPMPVVLEGLQVVADRLESRRKAVGISVRTLRAEDLVGRAGDMAQILRYAPGMILHDCRSYRTGGRTWCVYRRGGFQESRLFIDDRRAIGGHEELRGLPPEEVYAVEIYGWGRQVRVYTRRFMARLARRPGALEPFIF